MFRRILVATDFSDFAHEAWKVALEVAGRYGADLLLLHVQAMPLYVEAADADIRKVYEDERVAIQRMLDQQAGAASGVRVTTMVKTGAAAQAIAAVASDERVDLIVIATHGRSGLDRLLIGSVAERVVRLAPCAVLTVKARLG